MVNRTRHYHLTEGDSEAREVTEAEFVAAERHAGFINTLGRQDRPATAGFSGRTPDGKTISGRITYEGTE